MQWRKLTSLELYENIERIASEHELCVASGNSTVSCAPALVGDMQRLYQSIASLCVQFGINIDLRMDHEVPESAGACFYRTLKETCLYYVHEWAYFRETSVVCTQDASESNRDLIRDSVVNYPRGFATDRICSNIVEWRNAAQLMMCEQMWYVGEGGNDIHWLMHNWSMSAFLQPRINYVLL